MPQVPIDSTSSILASMARREYYFVEAVRPMSDGNWPHGRVKGFQWDHGYSGPHTYKEARRCAAIWGGRIVTMEDGLKSIRERKGELVDDEQGPADMTKVAASDTVETLDDELIASAAEAVTAREDLPDYDEVGYHVATSTMREAGFDYERVGGGKKGMHVKKAWDIFRSGETT